MSMIANMHRHIKRQKAATRRAQRTYYAAYQGIEGTAREIDTTTMAFRAEGAAAWQLVPRFCAALDLYGEVSLADTQHAADTAAGGFVAQACGIDVPVRDQAREYAACHFCGNPCSPATGACDPCYNDYLDQVHGA